MEGGDGKGRLVHTGGTKRLAHDLTIPFTIDLRSISAGVGKNFTLEIKNVDFPARDVCRLFVT